MTIQNALTIDVEDYFQVTNFEGDIRREDWPSYPSRVVKNTERILALLDRYHVKATFFVLGYVADRFPELVKSIDAAGHEIGSHSYWHRLIHQMTPDEFRDDLRRSRDVLENILGKPITAFRSPSFSINAKSLWALQILVEEGFTTDSSLIPIRQDLFRIPDGSGRPFTYQFLAGELCEFSIAVCSMWKRFGVPISGGGYFRLFPMRLSLGLLGRINERLELPFVFYTHPWEFDPDQPRLKAGSRLKRFRHYVNLSTMEAKFERLLQNFSFGRLDQVLANQSLVCDHRLVPAEGLAS